MTSEDPYVSYPFWISAQEQTQGSRRIGLVESYLENLNSEIVDPERKKAGSFISRGDTFGFLRTATGPHDPRAPCGLRSSMSIRIYSETRESCGIRRVSQGVAAQAPCRGHRLPENTCIRTRSGIIHCWDMIRKSGDTDEYSQRPR